MCWQNSAALGPAGSQALMQNWSPPMKLVTKVGFLCMQDRRQDLLVPFNDLLVGILISAVAWEGIRVHQTSERIAAL
jgi:hypothetical protein